MTELNRRSFLGFVGVSSSGVLAGCSGPFPTDNDARAIVFGQLNRTEDSEYRFSGGIDLDELDCQNATLYETRLVFLSSDGSVQHTVSLGTISDGEHSTTVILPERPAKTIVRADSYSGESPCTVSGTGIRWADQPESFDLNESTILVNVTPTKSL